MKKLTSTLFTVLSLFLLTPHAQANSPTAKEFIIEANDMSVRNTVFLRNGTNVSVIGVIHKQGDQFYLQDAHNTNNAKITLNLAQHLKIKEDMLDKEMLIIGKFTYKTMTFPDSIHTSYSFKMEVNNIKLISAKAAPIE